MTSERRYLLALTFSLDETPHSPLFVNVTTTIEGDLETGLERVKGRIVESYRQEGYRVLNPVILSALQIDTLRPPEWVELPIMVKRSIEQVLMDHKKGQRSSDACMHDIWEWLYKEV